MAISFSTAFLNHHSSYTTWMDSNKGILDVSRQWLDSPGSTSTDGADRRIC